MCATTTIDVDQSAGSVSTAVIEGIAALSDRDPVKLDFCLADHVDPDALDSLFATRSVDDATLDLTITLEEYEAIVRSNGRVTVTERHETADEGQSAALS